jgi:hypothetical protein
MLKRFGFFRHGNALPADAHDQAGSFLGSDFEFVKRAADLCGYTPSCHHMRELWMLLLMHRVKIRNRKLGLLIAE